MEETGKRLIRDDESQQGHSHTYQAEMGVYPFMFGAVMDFEPIVEAMIKVN